jgi:Ser/Thr protein kinase RdoA (MazF antagonist)
VVALGSRGVEGAVSAICQAALGEAPTSVLPILGDGRVNAVFEVRTADRPLILRVQPDGPEDGTFRKEQWCMERARTVGVPGAEVVALGTHEAYAYAIHTKLPGIVGSRSGADPDHMWREIGRLAARFHCVEALGFGEHLGGPVGDKPGPLGERPDTTLPGWVDWWDDYTFGTGLLADRGVVTVSGFDAARALLASVRDGSGEPRMCHGNLSLSNVLVDGERVFVIDWGTAAGHLAPLFDLAELHAWTLDESPSAVGAFLAGYEISRGAYAQIREPLAVLQLWRVLSGASWMLKTGRDDPQSIAFARNKTRRLLANVANP